MKRSLVLIGAIIVFCSFQSRRSDFSGTWKLDLRQSVNLPESFKGVEAYSMDVRQTSDSVIVVISLSGGGQNVKFPQTVYAFETYREDTLRGSKRWIKCIWETTGKKMVVTNNVRQKKDQAEVEYTQKDVWQLNDLNTVQISMTQSFATGDSTHSERRIFHRVK